MSEDNPILLKIRSIIDGKSETHIGKKKHRSMFILIIGLLLLLIMFTLALCIGPNGFINPIDAYSNLFSAIGKGGSNLTNKEVTIFSSRMPRAIAAIAVGIGLSVAGAAYQAIIRNPLVDPYIMGVSSGAGTFASRDLIPLRIAVEHPELLLGGQTGGDSEGKEETSE